MNTRNSKNCQKGFTLIEVLITIAIVAALAAIAVPAYLGYTEGVYTKVVQGDILRIQQAMETNYSENNFQYSVPSNDFIDQEIAEDNYTYTVTLFANAQQFIIAATPETGSSLIGNGALTLDSANVLCYQEGNDTPAKTQQAHIGLTTDDNSTVCPETL